MFLNKPSKILLKKIFKKCIVLKNLLNLETQNLKYSTYISIWDCPPYVLLFQLPIYTFHTIEETDDWMTNFEDRNASYMGTVKST